MNACWRCGRTARRSCSGSSPAAIRALPRVRRGPDVRAAAGLHGANGLASTHIYLRGLLNKVGGEPEFVKIRKVQQNVFPEQFTNDAASPDSAEETNPLLDDQFNRYLSTVAEERHIEPAKLKAIDKGVFTSDQALEAGYRRALDVRP